MNLRDYNSLIFDLRTIANQEMDLVDNRVLLALKKALKEISSQLELTNKESLTYVNLLSRKSAIESIIKQMTTEINFATRYGIRSTSESIVDAYKDIVTDFTKSKKYKISTDFSTVPVNAVKNVVSRVWTDDKVFSDRIWRLNRIAKSGINDILSTGVVKGTSAVEISKQLKQYLLDPEITPNVSWTTAVKPSVRGKGTIHYNALRLARTEINNSYRETLIEANKENPITLGIRWNLSKSHPVKDICDIWAESDLYGLGAGIYPPHASPIDHPNGLCYITDVLRPANQWSMPKQKFFAIRNLDKSEILSPLINMSPGQQNAAWVAYNKVQSMITNFNNQQLFKKAS